MTESRTTTQSTAPNVPPVSNASVQKAASLGEPPDEGWEWQQLAIASSCRFGQDSVLWTIIGSFWSTNAVLLVALGASGDWSKEPTLRIIICGTGLIVSGLWLVMQAAALRRVIAYEDTMCALEERLGVPAECRLLADSDREAGPKGKRVVPSARLVMPLAPPFALVMWAVGLYFAR